LSITAKSTIEKIVGLILPFIIGAGLIAASQHELAKAIEAKSWSPKEVVVYAAKIGSSRGTNNTRNEYFYMRGKYVDSGEEFKFTRFAYAGNRLKPKELLMRYPVGAKFTVYRNPNNHKETVLYNSSISPEMSGVSLVGLALIAVAIWGVFFVKVKAKS
jgi:hypothetical protein